MGRRASLASIALASSIALAPPLAPIARAASDPAALTDYVTDTKDMIARQRSLLRVGDGDLDAYVAKADAYFAGYKWDHPGHTNSFAALMNTDTIIRDNAAYLASAGQSWSPDTVPDGKSSKGRMLEGYLQNAERCVVKEGYGAFNEMDAETRKEWKAISCTQGLVSPADPM